MKKILMTLCAIGLVSSAAFAGSGKMPKKVKDAGIFCEYTLNIYDSNGNFLDSEVTLSYQGSGSCGRFFKTMRSYYTSQGYQLN
ncbi:hypothetical protein [Sphingobacterium sp. UDSM-2020]|uniref:hypothetical protein n=1 Tax=Sphingobacterium TaxID=28453 RepID=UPI0019384C19|nr:hypothetical protein [Sphingobacterium sp. UDSM-2020]QQD13460.1 hypothetical protein JAZ75_23185 [Sphingobacterium sp. UDSM-2020]